MRQLALTPDVSCPQRLPPARCPGTLENAQRLATQGLDPAPGTPAELTAYVRAETERFSKIIKLAGLKPAP